MASTGYTRQSTYIDGDIIKADDTNLEFNRLVTVFDLTNGHTHDGTVDQGAYIPLISDTTNTDKVEIVTGGAKTTGTHQVTGLLTADAGVTLTTGDVTLTTGNIVLTTAGATVDGRDLTVDGTKLDGIEAGATADQTAADIRGLGFFDITNDGTGSGLDADLLDGIEGASYARSDAIDTISAVHTHTAIPAFNGGTSGVSAPFTVDSTFLVTNLNADLLDGLNSTQFVRSDIADSVDGILTFTAIPAFNGGTSGTTAPFTVDSTFLVTNLNAEFLGGAAASSFHSLDASTNIYTTSTHVLRANTSDAADTSILQLAGGGGTSFTRGASISIAGNEHATTGKVEIKCGGNTGIFTVLTDNTERMRIDSSSRLLLGTTSTTLAIDTTGFGSSYIPNGSLVVARNDGATNFISNQTDYVSGTVTHMSFRENGVVRGNITSDGSTTAYNTTSDYRLKENVTDITNGIDRIKQLPVRRFNFIGRVNTVDGFLAHEAQAIVPESVHGVKDEVDADGNPTYQGIDQSKLVPLLTAALKETIDKLEALEARVAILEGV